MILWSQMCYNQVSCIFTPGNMRWLLTVSPREEMMVFNTKRNSKSKLQTRGEQQSPAAKSVSALWYPHPLPPAILVLSLYIQAQPDSNQNHAKMHQHGWGPRLLLTQAGLEAARRKSRLCVKEFVNPRAHNNNHCSPAHKTWTCCSLAGFLFVRLC